MNVILVLLATIWLHFFVNNILAYGTRLLIMKVVGRSVQCNCGESHQKTRDRPSGCVKVVVEMEMTECAQLAHMEAALYLFGLVLCLTLLDWTFGSTQRWIIVFAPLAMLALLDLMAVAAAWVNAVLMRRFQEEGAQEKVQALQTAFQSLHKFVNERVAARIKIDSGVE